MRDETVRVWGLPRADGSVQATVLSWRVTPISWRIRSAPLTIARY